MAEFVQKGPKKGETLSSCFVLFKIFFFLTDTGWLQRFFKCEKIKILVKNTLFTKGQGAKSENLNEFFPNLAEKS